MNLERSAPKTILSEPYHDNVNFVDEIKIFFLNYDDYYLDGIQQDDCMGRVSHL